jgi:hypothetical protein
MQHRSRPYERGRAGGQTASREAVLWLTAVLSLSTLLFVSSTSSARASVLVTSNETVGLAITSELTQIYVIFGADFSDSVQFNFSIDPTSGDFSYATLPGQIYDGESYSMSVAGTYDPTESTYNWTGSGLLGSTDLTEQGDAQWTADPPGDPVPEFNAVGTLTTTSGYVSNLTFSGSVTGTTDSGTGTLTLKHPNHTTDTVPLNITSNVPMGIYNNWTVTITPVGSPSYPYPTQGTFSTKTGSIHEVPEPTSLVLFGSGLASLALARRRRKKTQTCFTSSEPIFTD